MLGLSHYIRVGYVRVILGLDSGYIRVILGLYWGYIRVRLGFN